MMVWQYPTRFVPVATLLQCPLHCCHLFSVGCCVPLLNGGHLRPRPHPSLYFLMCFVCTPQTSDPTPASANSSFNTLLESRGAKGALLPYPWRESKLLDRAVVAAHFGCGVCVCGCVLCVGATFICHTGRKSTSAKAKWPTFVHSYHKICT
jgi:hypothetical protein